MKRVFVLLLLAVVSPLDAQINLTSSLVACYGLDGNAAEPVSNLTGTVGAVTPTPGHLNVAGGALHFDGTAASNITLPASASLKTNEFSFASWVKVDELANMTILFARNTVTVSTYFAYYALNISSYNGAFRFAPLRQNPYTGYYPQSTTAVTANTWYHLAFTFDSNSLKIYVNGSLENYLTIPASVTFTCDVSKPVILGGTNEAPLNYFKGSLDNARFYSRSLTAGEVTALYALDADCNTIITGIKEAQAFTAVRVFPNPASEKLVLASDLEGTYEFWDLYGKRLAEGKFYPGANNTLDIHDLAKGMYLLRINSGTLLRTERVLKE